MTSFTAQTQIYDRIAAGGQQGCIPVVWDMYGLATDTSIRAIWPASGDYTFRAADVKFVSAASANDTAAGTGARTVRVWGIDSNYNFKTEDVTLNGQTAVNLAGGVATYILIYKMKVLTAGSGNANATRIYAGNGGPSSGIPTTIDCVIYNGDNDSKVGLFGVPAGFSLYIKSISVSTALATGAAHLFGLWSNYNGSPIAHLETKHGFTSPTMLTQRFDVPLVVGEKTLLQAKITNGTASDTYAKIVGYLASNTIQSFLVG